MTNGEYVALIEAFRDMPDLAAECFEQMLEAEAQFGSTDEYFWEKHGHQAFMQRARKMLHPYGVDA